MSKTRKDNDFDVRVGSRMKKYRELANMSQQEIANRLNVTRTAVCHWESGERALYLTTAKQICSILNITLEELVGL